jgi:hypothetical protein
LRIVIVIISGRTLNHFTVAAFRERHFECTNDVSAEISPMVVFLMDEVAALCRGEQ